MKPELNAKHIPTGPAVTGFLGRTQGSSKIQQRTMLDSTKKNPAQKIREENVEMVLDFFF